MATRRSVLVLGGLLWLAESFAVAAPILSIDMDPAMPGVQTSLTVTPGTEFSIDVLLSANDTPFNAVFLHLLWNDEGDVLGPGPNGAVAGAATGTQPTIDPFSLAFTSPGTPLSQFPLPVDHPIYGSSSGAMALLALGTFPTTPPEISLLSFDFVAHSPGVSRIVADGPMGNPEFALLIEGIHAGANVPGSITVARPAPEPGVASLFLLGAVGALYFRRKS